MSMKILDKENKYTRLGVLLGMGIGAGLGSALLDNVAIGIGIGVVLIGSIGLVIDKKTN